MADVPVSTLVKSGPAIIVSSGSATTYDAHPLSVQIEMPDGSVYTLLFRCSVDPTQPEPAIETELHPWGLELSLTNFTEGRGSAVPVALGRLGKYTFYLHFRVFRWGRTDDHTVHWNFFAVPV